MENSAGKGKAKRTISNLLITLAFGLFYYYNKLPAINLQDPAFYTFVLLLSAVYCFLSILTQGLFKAESGRELWQSVKTHCAVPVIICAVLAAIFIVGSLLSSPIIRAGAYKNLLTVEQGDFATEVKQISFSQIPMLDEASAI